MRPAAAPFVLAALVAASACRDATAPDRITLALTPVDSNLVFPVLVTAPPADPSRLLVVERAGRIVLRKDGVRRDTPFLDLSALTGGGHEYGVLGLAFHPAYATNRRLFVYYIDNDGHGRLDEYRAAAGFDHVEPEPVRTVLALPFPDDAIHYGGTIAFGPDGYLHVALGDGRTGGSPTSPAQDSTSLFGKMLRLDVDAGGDATTAYGIPADNPYVGRPGWRSEILLRGLRNPYRWSFDRGTGDLYIGDVGEDVWEEVNFRPARFPGGDNFGWPVMEGPDCYRPSASCDRTGLVPPTVAYAHGTEGCSVIGGYVYRGERIPELRGAYLYGDFCGGWIRWLAPSGGHAAIDGSELSSPIADDNVLGFGEDAAGELYVAMLSGWVYRVDAAPLSS